MAERNLDFDKITDRRNTNCLKYDFAVKRGMPGRCAASCSGCRYGFSDIFLRTGCTDQTGTAWDFCDTVMDRNLILKLWKSDG